MIANISQVSFLLVATRPPSFQTLPTCRASLPRSRPAVSLRMPTTPPTHKQWPAQALVPVDGRQLLPCRQHPTRIFAAACTRLSLACLRIRSTITISATSLACSAVFPTVLSALVLQPMVPLVTTVPTACAIQLSSWAGLSTTMLAHRLLLETQLHAHSLAQLPLRLSSPPLELVLLFSAKLVRRVPAQLLLSHLVLVPAVTVDREAQAQAHQAAAVALRVQPLAQWQVSTLGPSSSPSIPSLPSSLVLE